MRHMTQAFFMIFKENLRFGAFPPNQKSELYDKCGCDGEFSEHELCRSWWLFLQGDKTHTTIDLRPHGLCSYFDAEVYSPNMNRTYFTYEHEVYSFATVLSCNEIRERPAFIFLNAGAHFRTDINRVIGEYLTSMLTQIKAAFNDCMDRVHIVFLGTIVCADHVEKMYPHQARALSNDFNVKISSWLHEHHPNVLFLNPWNITREAVRRTSDGFHGLSDTNMLHATTMLNLMHAFLK